MTLRSRWLAALLQRLGARRTMMLCDAARAPLLALVPALYWGGLLRFPPPSFGARRVILPEPLPS